MQKNKPNSKNPTLYQSAALEQLGKNIHEKPMVIEKEEAKHKQAKKMKVGYQKFILSNSPSGIMF